MFDGQLADTVKVTT